MVAPPRAPLRADRLRAVNVPQPAAVELDADGRPTVVRADKAVRTVVESVLESWCIDDEWWRQLISRRYFEVVLKGGGRVVVFEDLTSGEWFVQTA